MATSGTDTNDGRGGKNPNYNGPGSARPVSENTLLLLAGQRLLLPVAQDHHTELLAGLDSVHNFAQAVASVYGRAFGLQHDVVNLNAKARQRRVRVSDFLDLQPVLQAKLLANDGLHAGDADAFHNV